MNNFDELLVYKNNVLEARREEHSQAVSKKGELEREQRSNQKNLEDLEKLIPMYERYKSILENYKPFMRQKRFKHLINTLKTVLIPFIVAIMLMKVLMPEILDFAMLKVLGLFAFILVIGLYTTSTPEGARETIEIHRRFTIEGLTKTIEDLKKQKIQALEQQSELNTKINAISETKSNLELQISNLEQEIGYIIEQRHIVIERLEANINQEFAKDENLCRMRERNEE